MKNTSKPPKNEMHFVIFRRFVGKNDENTNKLPKNKIRQVIFRRL